MCNDILYSSDITLETSNYLLANDDDIKYTINDLTIIITCLDLTITLNKQPNIKKLEHCLSILTEEMQVVKFKVDYAISNFYHITHMYYKYNTYEEFIQLPSYKYIIANFTADKLFINEEQTIFKELIDGYTILLPTKWKEHINYTFKKLLLLTDHPINYHSQSIDNIKDVFYPSITMHNHKYSISSTTTLYIMDIIIGWFLSNLSISAKHLISIELYVDGPKLDIVFIVNKEKSILLQDNKALYIKLPQITRYMINKVLVDIA
jgi:hypothetical protein